MAASIITLNIPGLPDKDLTSNRRRNRAWQAQAADTRTERERAFVQLREAALQVARLRGCSSDLDILGPGRLAFPVVLRWTLYFGKGQRAWDEGACAAALKPWVDAMTPPIAQRTRNAVGLAWLPNDSPKYVAEGCYRPVPSSPLGPSMRLAIWSE